MTSFTILTEPSKIHYHVKFHQNLTSSFEIIGILIQKYQNSFLPSYGNFWSHFQLLCRCIHAWTGS